jgi:hypothetical protein
MNLWKFGNGSFSHFLLELFMSFTKFLTFVAVWFGDHLLNWSCLLFVIGLGYYCITVSEALDDVDEICHQ